MPVYLFALLSLLLSFTSPARAGLPSLANMETKGSFLPVEQAFKPRVERVDDHWAVHFDIAEGYYLYQQRAFTTPQLDETHLQFVQTPSTKMDKNFGQVAIFHDQLDLRLIIPANQPLTLTYQGCSEQQLCYPPQTLTIQSASSAETSPAVATSSANSPVSGGFDSGRFAADRLGSGSHSLLWVLLSFLGLGFGLSLTPCVFPMVPILASIIAGQSSKSMSAGRGFALSLSYVVGMASSYAMIGALVAAFGAKVNMAAITQTPLVIGLSALLFVVLALSMFGLFEIQLPAAIRNRLYSWSQQQQGGQFMGSYLMGFFSALVVSPCVSAPLAGALIYLSTTGDVLTGASALFALGMGMGIPLLLIGVSGGRLLPKSGNWMLVIRSAFGVALLGVAVFLMIRIIGNGPAMALAGVLALGVAVFLKVLERPTTNPERLARTLGIAALVVGVLWLVGAARGSDNWLQPLADPTVNRREAVTPSNDTYSSPVALMQAIQNSSDNRPVLVDVWATWCASCREMDELLKSGAVTPALGQYRLLRLDISRSTPDQLKLLTELGVFGPPALQMYNRNGDTLAPALQGLPETDGLVQWLNSQGKVLPKGLSELK